MPVITSTTYTVTLDSYASLEALLIPSAALLLDIPHDKITYKVAPGISGGASLEMSTTSALNATPITANAVGWMGSIRLLAATSRTLSVTGVQESWLEAANLTLMPILKQGKKDAAFDKAVQEFAQRIEEHLTSKSSSAAAAAAAAADGAFLTDSSISLADICVAQILAATCTGLGVTNLPPACHAWLSSTLETLSTVLPFDKIPGWRMFGLHRQDIWKEWKETFQVGTADPSLTQAPSAAPGEATLAPVTTPVAEQDSSFSDPDNVLLKKLQETGTAHSVYGHTKCMTAEELVANVPIPAGHSHTKNLFLRDKKHGHYLITVHPDSHVNTKTLGKDLGLSGKVNLRMADPAILADKLGGVQPGCVGPLCMATADLTLDDKERVTLVLDQALLKAETIHTHPMRNDASVQITPANLQAFLKAIGVEPVILEFGPKPEGGADAKPAAPKQPKQNQQQQAKKKQQGVVEKKSNKKGETLLALQWKKSDNFPQWYTDVITLSEMISYYDISGCYILRPWSYKMWELIQYWFNDKIEKLGVENSYFPMFVSQDRLEKEKDHVEGFAPEVAWVTKSGDGDLAKPIAVRPTSETIMYPAYSDWIQSHRDLPLKLNQWSNVVRWEFKYPTPFLRTREFLWQEGHTAHATFEDAEDMVMKALDLYRRVYEELLAVPVVPGYKTEKEKFAGGFRTTTVEAYIAGSGRAIQGATSHNLGQNFGKMFDITFQNKEGKTEIAWQTSWGLTTRTIGVMVMVHGDDTGLVLPPRIAPVQVVIIPIISKKLTLEDADPYCKALVEELQAAGVRVKYDDRDLYNPGWKYNHWEQKGVPIRMEVGPRDIEQKSVRMVLRYNGEKKDVQIDGIGKNTAEMLESIQDAMFAKAKDARDTHLVKVTDWKDFVPNLEKNNLVLVPWCGGEHQEWEEKAKDLSREESLKARGEEGEDEKTATSLAAKTLCIPFDQPELPAGTKCIISGMDATCWCLWGRSY